MKELCAISNQLLELVPPSATVDVQQSTENLGIDAIQQVDLRAMAEMDDFEKQLDDVLQTFHGPNYRRIQSSRDLDSASPLKCIDVVRLANEIILASSSTSECIYDRETLDIARLIRTLDQLQINVSYNLLDEETLDDERLLCILRINNDSSFVKYNNFVKREGSGGLMLFRGFCIELVPSNDSNVANEHKDMEVGASLHVVESTQYEEKLMLKMKFLPYMVRTFICRNGLPILMNDGIPSFENYAMNQLAKWNVSDEAVRKWMPFFQGWSKYCTSPLDASLPPLTEKKYLHHYYRFDELFTSGRFQVIPEMASSFHGLIVIVGPSKDDLRALSLGLSSELHCSKIVDDIRQISEKMVMLSKQRSRGGLICITEIEGRGATCLRRLAKKHHEAIFIIIVQGGNGISGGINNNSPKFDGMIKSWKNTKCNMMLELPRESAMQLDGDATIEYLRSNDTAKEVLAKLKACSESQQPDEHPGLIVYFPLIPGCGKSSLCRDITAEALGIGNGRKLVQMEGDQIKGKFYDVVAKELLSKPSSVAILDKNVPPSSFPSVHKLCAESNSIALYVLPTGMADTCVGESMDVYPFTLQFLAVCMARILNRKPGTHAGKLDAAVEDACMVVVKFYCFYRNLTASRLKEKLRDVGYQGKVIFVPFFRDEILPDLPTELKQALEDAVTLQTRDDKKICKVDKKDWTSMDKRLRSSIMDNRSYIDSLTVPLEGSRSMFTTELSNVIISLPDKLQPVTLHPAGSIQIASLDFDFGLVHAEIEKLRQIYPDIDQYFSQREANKNNDQDDESKDRYITSVHCTFAHASQVSQTSMFASFQHLIGSTAEMKATAFLFNEKIAALELEVPNDDSIPRPNNAFPHVTIWCSENSQAYESNDLPEMVKCNKATRVEFGEHVAMRGVFSFWYNPIV
ncbi:hypothetical protein ACHAW5_007068 [Stephanodiscus triporus]|uniref:tRNA ligase phosphodiesterase domain-containing protein n=1 Tax=Stephanodiscus triporus TaxID=2934178 RepID=A0ABD3Q6V1_9STRA